MIEFKGFFIRKRPMIIRVAIMVDGAFYLKRAHNLMGEKNPRERAKELADYCNEHLKKNKNEEQYLYRVFYYDCPPSIKAVYHPLLKTNINLKKTDMYAWKIEFLNELKHQRKFALRMGRLAEEQAQYALKPDVTRMIIENKKDVNGLTADDFTLNIQQKGVDMKIGIDIASLAFKKQVDRIILISGDSDFVPAAKQARREGIDFILDPMYLNIKEDLFEHIDGLRTCAKRMKK